MSEPFTKFKYLFPPRTQLKCSFSSPVVDLWKKLPDAIAQFKLNGTRNLIYVLETGEIQFWNRHGQEQKQFSVTPILKAQIDALGLQKGLFHVIDSEMIEAKTKDFKNILYVFDILVKDSIYLLGQPYSARYALLHNMMEGKYFPRDFNPLPGMYLAENFPQSQWDWMWAEAQKVSYCEGMVLKRTGTVSKLETGYREINNDAGFMLRVRKPTKNYRF